MKIRIPLTISTRECDGMSRKINRRQAAKGSRRAIKRLIQIGDFENLPTIPYRIG